MDDRISDLLYHAYGSVLDMSRWPDLLDRLVVALDARGAVMVVQERGLAFAGFTAASRSYTEPLSEKFAQYQSEYAVYEADAWARLAERAPGEAFFDSELGLPLPELDAMPHYRFAAEELDIGRRIAFRVNDSRVWFDAIALAYQQGRTDLPKGIERTISAVSPHLGRAVELTRTFNFLRKRYAAVLGVLDRLDFGIAIALPSGEIIVANEEAERILDEADAIRRRPDSRLECTGPNNMTAELTAAITEISRTARGQANRLSAPMRITRRTTGPPVLIDVAPIRDASAEIESDLAGAIVYLMDMARPHNFETGRFARLYGLTDAETEVCRYLLEGYSSANIAEKRATSLHTVRDQAKAVLQKTGCTNRAELFRLLVKIIPPMRY
ncbi:helix-turn-helix transcriptional regulator [Roseivivax marinus]|uniref:helix-turn-helix transcriptional regulator n=1 Tax=Roseivivax marinus TaxID=1379903 RepID=UPI00273E1971|nr:helix-turn-helix transcriptional regulator [Roseivivax marinus]